MTEERWERSTHRPQSQKFRTHTFPPQVLAVIFETKGPPHQWQINRLYSHFKTLRPSFTVFLLFNCHFFWGGRGGGVFFFFFEFPLLGQKPFNGIQ